MLDVAHRDTQSHARRKEVLPLVCKQWARALRGPSHAWRVASISGTSWYAEFGRPEEQVQLTKEERAIAALAWLASRPG